MHMVVQDEHEKVQVSLNTNLCRHWTSDCFGVAILEVSPEGMLQFKLVLVLIFLIFQLPDICLARMCDHKSTSLSNCSERCCQGPFKVAQSLSGLRSNSSIFRCAFYGGLLVTEIVDIHRFYDILCIFVVYFIPQCNTYFRTQFR